MKRVVNLSILLALMIYVASVNNGCVSVQNSSFNMDAGNVPENKAVVFIAVSIPFPDYNTNLFQLNIGNSKTVFLQAEAINRIYIPAGWQGMVLKNVDQEESSKNTKYEFKKNGIHYFALIEKNIVIESEDQNVEQSVYKLVPTTKQAFQLLGAESNLPLVTVF